MSFVYCNNQQTEESYHWTIHNILVLSKDSKLKRQPSLGNGSTMAFPYVLEFLNSALFYTEEGLSCLSTSSSCCLDRVPEFSVQHWQVQHNTYRKETCNFWRSKIILSPTTVLAQCQLKSEFQQSILHVLSQLFVFLIFLLNNKSRKSLQDKRNFLPHTLGIAISSSIQESQDMLHEYTFMFSHNNNHYEKDLLINVLS